MGDSLSHLDDLLLWLCSLANLNPDFATENSIFCSVEDQTNLRLQSERSISERGSFRLVSRSGLR